MNERKNKKGKELLNIKTFHTLLITAGMLFISVGLLANDARIIVMPESPLKILSYEARYQPELGRVREGIIHRIKLKNIGDQDVVAYRISFQAFDVFNRNMGRPLGGVSIDTVATNEKDSGTWTHRPSAAFTFKKYGTGVAYVSLVRLADGTIWEADMDHVLLELQKIEEELSLEDIIPE